MLLAGDIGGTKTNLALFDEAKSDIELEFSSYHSQAYPNLHQIVLDYLKKVKKTYPDLSISAACFAIAGPVKEGICKATNLPWLVDAKGIAKACGIPSVYLINDLEANAHAIDILSPNQLLALKGKHFIGNRAVVSPGTGLGEAGLFWDGIKHRPFACEGGHCDFAPKNPLQLELCDYLIERFGHASYERILSGPGLQNVYDFFVEVKKHTPPRWLLEEMKERDRSAVISENALNGKCDVCMEALDVFVSILGAEAGNCALKFMALGGVFLGGGIPPKILPKLKEPFFFRAFTEKGRLSDFLEDIPIYVILEEKASLKGAAHYCRTQVIVDSVSNDTVGQTRKPRDCSSP